MPDGHHMRALEALRTMAGSEVAHFAEWASGELADRLTTELRTLGLPPMLARAEAMTIVRHVCTRAFGAAKAFHKYQRF